MRLSAARLVTFAWAALFIACAAPPAAVTPTPAPSPAAAPARATPPAPPTPATAATPATAPRLPNDIRWVRTSAEYRALALQAFRAAEDRLPEVTRGLAAGSWGVILDADETVLDNSEYQRRLSVLGAAYAEPTWSAWVRERAATAIPGAAEFTRRVRASGGRVAIVTNRADSLCAATRENLAAVGIETDLVLCQLPGEGDKNLRFTRIQNGAASAAVPALTVVEWIGDNIQDFPRLTQASRADPAALVEFGRRYFLLPNPMYGSWERLPP